MSKKDADIYIESARALLRGDYSMSGYTCNIIDWVAGYPHTISPQTRKYTKHFSPTVDPSNAWLNTAVEQGMLRNGEMQDWRLTALCFAAAMAEAGDL